MARIRTIKPDFWTSGQIMDLSINARLAFIGLWNFCDDQGVHTASAKRLKAELFPSDEITVEAVGQLVAELVKQGLVAEFDSHGSAYWHVTGWAKHQVINRPTYRHPAPLGPASAGRATSELPEQAQGAITESSMSTHDVINEPSMPEGKGMEGKGQERNIGAAAPESVCEIPIEAPKPTPAKKKAPSGVENQSPNLGVRELVADGVNRQHAEDWLKVRKAKRMPLTRSAWDSTVAEAGRAGFTRAEAVRIAAERGWGSFMATYCTNLTAIQLRGGVNGRSDHFNPDPDKFKGIEGGLL